MIDDVPGRVVVIIGRDCGELRARAARGLHRYDGLQRETGGRVVLLGCWQTAVVGQRLIGGDAGRQRPQTSPEADEIGSSRRNAFGPLAVEWRALFEMLSDRLVHEEEQVVGHLQR